MAVSSDPGHSFGLDVGFLFVEVAMRFVNNNNTLIPSSKDIFSSGDISSHVDYFNKSKEG